MNTYLILLRGINVGGKNKVPMAELRDVLGKAGYFNVTTYIASGNVLLDSDKTKKQVGVQVEKLLPKHFNLDSELIKILVLTPRKLEKVISDKPRGFGDSPKKYHSDVIFLMDITAAQASKAFNPKEGVDTIWQGKGVIYSQRLSSQRTKSRLSKIASSPLYKSMTIRNWNTTTKLQKLLGERKKQ